MSERFSSPAFEDLVSEQTAVQADKFQARILDQYDYEYVFPGECYEPPRSNEVADFLRPLCPESEMSVENVLEGLYAANGRKPIHWADIGGGHGLAMRQYSALPAARGKVITTNVDLINYNFAGLDDDDFDTLERHVPGILDEASAPRLVIADAEYVALDTPAHLITSIETMQYLRNPLGTVSNLYNQLADNGLLIVSTGHNWARYIGYRQNDASLERTYTVPTRDFFNELTQAGVAHATSYGADEENGHRPSRREPEPIRTAVIQKLPGSKLVLNASVIGQSVSLDGYKSTRYEDPRPLGQPIVEVTAA